MPGISVCGVCRGENPPGMKFCRNCGAQLPASRPSSQASHPALQPTGLALGPNVGLQPTSLAMPPVRAAQGSTIACPRCGTQTPLGFSFCQQCGLRMDGSDPGASRAGRASAPQLPKFDKLDAPIDPHAGTIAQDDGTAPTFAVSSASAAALPVRGAPLRVRSQTGPAPLVAWGTAVLVNRDGSDGQRFQLTGEQVIIGRAGADLAFDDDRFLAHQHARLDRGRDGATTLHPLDTLNGVFRKADAPIELVDGMTILAGREVLRFERVLPEEAVQPPLIRHGIALFGSPPREPWGRVIQLLPSGGYRDVRHLFGNEVVLGREEGELVFRDDAFLSRRHAALTWNGQRAQLTDLGSSNGTFVRITAATVLKHGDHIRLGDQLLRFELGRPEAR